MPVVGKIHYFDYDFVSAKDDVDTSEAVCFTWAERQILLTMVDYIGWQTRWQSKIGTTVLQDKIDGWRDSITRKLALQDCAMDCDDVIACVVADLTGQGDFWQWLQANGGTITPGGDVNSPDYSGEIYDDLNEGITCDRDYLFGFAKQLIPFIHSLIMNLFNAIEAGTNFIDICAAVSSKVPAISGFFDFIAYLNDSIRETYEASYTTALENEYACDLMCLAYGSNCEFTWADLMSYFAERCATDWFNLTIYDLLQFILGGGWTGTDFCDVMFFAFTVIMGKGGTWAGLSLDTVMRNWRAMLNDPNEDWSELCDCGWKVYYVLNEEQQEGWDVLQGQWATPLSVYSVVETNNEARIERYFDSFDGLTEVRIWRLWDEVVKAGQIANLTVYHGGGVYTNSKAIGAGAYNEVVWSGLSLDDVTRIVVIMRHNDIPEGGSVAISALLFEGTGDNPPDKED